jgi:ABC-type spermidine/putrescine transport system permease subunit I
MRIRSPVRLTLLAVPIAFMTVFLLVPLGLTIVVSFWQRAGLRVRPAFTLASYLDFFQGVRVTVLERSLLISVEATLISLFLAYPIAYVLAYKARSNTTRTVLLLLTVPFLINYIIRTFAWAYLLGRAGPINSLLLGLGIVSTPVDWLLFSDFAVFIGLISSYMPFMIFPLWISLSGIDHRLTEASWMLGAPPLRTFLRITLPLSLPGVFAAVIFGFVGCFGESAVPVILGGVGYQLMGNTITSTLDVLNYPLAAAMSSVVVITMLILLGCWYAVFDMSTFLGKILRWRV